MKRWHFLMVNTVQTRKGRTPFEARLIALSGVAVRIPLRPTYEETACSEAHSICFQSDIMSPSYCHERVYILFLAAFLLPSVFRLFFYTETFTRVVAEHRWRSGCYGNVVFEGLYIEETHTHTRASCIWRVLISSWLLVAKDAPEKEKRRAQR